MASADLTQPRLVRTREVPAVHLIGLAVHLTVLQVRISESSQDVLPETPLRDVACVQSAARAWPLVQVVTVSIVRLVCCGVRDPLSSRAIWLGWLVSLNAA